MDDLQHLADVILDQEAGLAEGRYVKAGEYLIPAAHDDPPQREWGVRHLNGKVGVQVDGHPFGSRSTAEAERIASDEEGPDCDLCDGGTHTLVYRDRQPWQTAP